MKHLTLLLLLSFTLFACQKELSFDSPIEDNTSGNSNTNYFIKCKVNGTGKTFNFNSMAKITNLVNILGFNLIGSASSDINNKEGINLSINFSSGGPAVGTYSETDTTLTYVAAGVYNPNSSALV